MGDKKLIDGDTELFHLWYFVWRPLHVLMEYGKVEVGLQHHLTLALDWDEKSASRPGRITAGEKAPSAH